MNEPASQIIWAVLGLVIGAAISWVFARAREQQAVAAASAAAAQASTGLQIELSSARERASRVPDLESQLAANAQALNVANERKAALESEILRLPELERRRAQATEALEQAARTSADFRDLSSRLSAELAAERDNLASLRSRSEETNLRFEAKTAEASWRSPINSRPSPTRFSRRSPSGSLNKIKQTWAPFSIP
jgi:DNA recombination protein RmuC